jgi:hypothetical protein
MSIAYDVAIKRFKDGVVNLITKQPFEQAASSSVYFKDRQTIYSFGSHFPLAIRGNYGPCIEYDVVKSSKPGEVDRTRYEYLINGDYYSRTTSYHQNEAIRVLVPNIVLPFSALDGARIQRETICVIDRRPDRTWYACSKCDREVEYRWGVAEGMVQNNRPENLDPEYTGYAHMDDGTPMCDGAEHNWKHLLGAVLFQAKNEMDEYDYYLSSTDEQEPLNHRNAAYFLCKLCEPAASITEVYESLQPFPVRKAFEEGLKVLRQGDVFAVPTPLMTKQIPAKTRKRAYIFDISTEQYRVPAESHTCSELHLVEQVDGNEWYGRGIMRHEPYRRLSQHKRVRLGNVWYRFYKNTAIGSWSAEGRVD